MAPDSSLPRHGSPRYTEASRAAYAGEYDLATLRFNDVPGGSNVLYLDGHVSWQKLNSGFPILMPTAANPMGVHPDAFAITFTSYWIQLAGGWG